MNKKILFIAFASLALTSQPAISKDPGAGCGLGEALIDGETGVGAHVGAWALNRLILPQSFSQTSGILGCDTTQMVNNDYQKEKFVASNMDNLSADMAQGEGDHLTILASLMGVAEEDRAKFFELTQKNYDKIYSSPKTDATMMLSALSNEMAMNPHLATYVR